MRVSETPIFWDGAQLPAAKAISQLAHICEIFLDGAGSVNPTAAGVRESAQILSSALSLRVHVEPGLAGPRRGDADGQPWAEVKTAFGGPPQSDPDRPYAPGSETWNQYLARTGAALAGLISRHAGQQVLIAGHSETVEAAATLLLGLPAGTCTRAGFQVGHASLTRWHMQRNRFGQEVWVFTALNDTAHLPQAAYHA
jgi:2,3-bisphosphoglycerate-dependent phosphoglycerate mutase